MANYDWNHDYWKLNKDVAKKLKEEDTRAAFLRSSNNFETFWTMLDTASVTKTSGQGAFKSHMQTRSPSPGRVSFQHLNSPSGPSLQIDGSGSNFFALTTGNFAHKACENLYEGPTITSGGQVLVNTTNGEREQARFPISGINTSCLQSPIEPASAVAPKDFTK